MKKFFLNLTIFFFLLFSPLFANANGGSAGGMMGGAMWNMMNWGGGGMAWAWACWIFSILVFFAVILGIVAFIKWIFEKDQSSMRNADGNKTLPNETQNKKTQDEKGGKFFSNETPMEILKKRYARGDISKEEFDIRKKDLV